jgi:glycosyltransferase involved in cell wall biosynthesis
VSAPPLSVVVASVNGLPYVERCLEALRSHAPDAEVIVADSTDERTREELARRWPGVRLLTFGEPRTIPELRASGIFAASAPYVAVIEDHCLVTDGWARSMLEAHGSGHPVVGGPIRNVEPRVRDWAAFLFEYASAMEPAGRGQTEHLPGMNVSYDRAAISVMEDLLRAGRWETWLHERLRARGIALFREPGAVVEHAKDFGIREFASQRFHYARGHAAMCNEYFSLSRRVLYAIGSPALVPLLLLRIGRSVFSRRRERGRFVLALPLLLLYCAITAVGEGSGYVAGDRGSLLKVR